MYGPYAPAPNRDLANVPPFVPPDSQQMNPTSRRIAGSLMIAIGTGVLLNLLFRTFLDMHPRASEHLLISDGLAVMAAICFFACGVTIFYRGVIWSTVFLTGGLLLAIFSKWMG